MLNLQWKFRMIFSRSLAIITCLGAQRWEKKKISESKTWVNVYTKIWGEIQLVISLYTTYGGYRQKQMTKVWRRFEVWSDKNKITAVDVGTYAKLKAVAIRTEILKNKTWKQWLKRGLSEYTRESSWKPSKRRGHMLP